MLVMSYEMTTLVNDGHGRNLLEAFLEFIARGEGHPVLHFLRSHLVGSGHTKDIKLSTDIDQVYILNLEIIYVDNHWQIVRSSYSVPSLPQIRSETRKLIHYSILGLKLAAICIND